MTACSEELSSCAADSARNRRVSAPMICRSSSAATSLRFVVSRAMGASLQVRS